MSDGRELPRLWVAYLWSQREEGNFAYLVPQLKAAGVEAIYDSIEVDPDLRLEEWFGGRLAANHIDGLVYLLTPLSVMRKNCTDELLAVLNLVFEQKGPDFPVVGLLNGVGQQNLPPTLRGRPSFHVTDPQWRNQVASLLRNRAERTVKKNETRFVWTVHTCFGADAESTAVEVGARQESIPYWRFAVPKSVQPVKWGQGPRGGGEISPIKFSVVRGSARMSGATVTWFGAANAVSLTESAYLVFAGRLPEFICFGPALGPQGPPDKMEMFRPPTPIAHQRTAEKA
jgi:hypothetical protein